MSEVYMPKGGGKSLLDKLLDMKTVVAWNDSPTSGSYIYPGKTTELTFTFMNYDHISQHYGSLGNFVLAIGTLYVWEQSGGGATSDRYIPVYIWNGKSEEYIPGSAKWPIKIKYDARNGTASANAKLEITNLTEYTLCVYNKALSNVIAFLPG